MLKIEQIQTKTLYCQYQTKKKQLEQQNPGMEVEKTLWHGTAPGAVDNINRYGFNRSYCGKNGKLNLDFNIPSAAQDHLRTIQMVRIIYFLLGSATKNWET